MANDDPRRPVWAPNLVPNLKDSPLTIREKFEGQRFQVPEEFLDRYPAKPESDPTTVRKPIVRDGAFVPKTSANMDYPFGKQDAYPSS